VQFVPDAEFWAQVLALRLAVLFYRSRMDIELLSYAWSGMVPLYTRPEQ